MVPKMLGYYQGRTCITIAVVTKELAAQGGGLVVNPQYRGVERLGCVLHTAALGTTLVPSLPGTRAYQESALSTAGVAQIQVKQKQKNPHPNASTRAQVDSIADRALVCPACGRPGSSLNILYTLSPTRSNY